jgi:hypothetical protein
MGFTDTANKTIKLGDSVLFDEPQEFGFEGAMEGVFVFNTYYKQHGFSFDGNAFLPYDLVKHAEVSFYKLGD